MSGLWIFFWLCLFAITVTIIYFTVNNKKDGSKCTPTADEIITGGDTYIRESSNCVVSNCIIGYTLSKGICLVDEDNNQLDGLKLITDDFSTGKSNNLFGTTSNLFSLHPGEYIESTESRAPEDGKILGMYLTEDVFVVYRRNDDSSVFETIFSVPNNNKINNN